MDVWYEGLLSDTRLVDFMVVVTNSNIREESADFVTEESSIEEEELSAFFNNRLFIHCWKICLSCFVKEKVCDS